MIDVKPWTGLEIALLWVACLLAGALAGALWEIRRLHQRLFSRWLAEDKLQREIELLHAGRAHDLGTYTRRVGRWEKYANELLQFCVREGLLAQWRADADRNTMPFVNSEIGS